MRATTLEILDGLDSRAASFLRTVIICNDGDGAQMAAHGPAICILVNLMIWIEIYAI